MLQNLKLNLFPYSASGSWTSLRGIRVADLTNDKKVDIIFNKGGFGSDSGLYYMENINETPPGTRNSFSFAAPVKIPNPILDPLLRSNVLTNGDWELADLDGDGNLDIVQGIHRNDATVDDQDNYIHWGKGDGTFDITPLPGMSTLLIIHGVTSLTHSPTLQFLLGTAFS